MQQTPGALPNPIFLPDAFTCVVLDLNPLLLWISGGAIRTRNDFAVNPE